MTAPDCHLRQKQPSWWNNQPSVFFKGFLQGCFKITHFLSYHSDVSDVRQ